MIKGDVILIEKRAREIVNSPGFIDVILDDKPIWIESISNNGETANVKDLETNEMREVLLSRLQEKDRF